MIYDNEFTCPDGHSFKANAKLRARCPECGKLTRRFVKKSDMKHEAALVVPETPETPETPESPEVPEPKDPPKRKVELIRRGRPKVMAKKASLSAKMPKPTKRIAKVPVKLVSNVRLRGKIKPRINRMPSKTAVARHVQPKSYGDEMIDRYGF